MGYKKEKKNQIKKKFFFYISNLSEVIRSVSVFMKLNRNDSLGVGKKSGTTELLIFLPSRKYLMWNLTFVIR